jgi:hypothetical protein
MPIVEIVPERTQPSHKGLLLGWIGFIHQLIHNQVSFDDIFWWRQNIGDEILAGDDALVVGSRYFGCHYGVPSQR